MKNKALNIGLVAGLLPHLFCCGLPIALSVIGLAMPGTAHWHILPHGMEPWLFGVSGLMLALSWALVVRDCHCECDDCAAPRKHRIQKIILLAITLIFAVSLVLHFLTHSH